MTKRKTERRTRALERFKIKEAPKGGGGKEYEAYLERKNAELASLEKKF